MDRSRLILWWLVGLTCSGCGFVNQGHNINGVRHYQQGQFQAALNEFQIALKNDPRNGDALYNMARTYHQQGKAANDANLLVQAEALYNQCLALSPNHVESYRGLAVLYAETGKQDRALELLKNWARSNPANGEPLVELARLYEEHGDVATAQGYLFDAVRANRDNSRAWAALGRLREETATTAADYQQALANYQNSLRTNPLQPKVAERVALLNQAIRGNGAASYTDTRTVNQSLPPRR